MLESIEISPQDCRDLLRAGIAGRVAFSAPDGPHILPVNYTVLGQAILIKTSPGGSLASGGAEQLLAFEIGAIDVEHHRGWSVVARGRATVVTDGSVAKDDRAAWTPRPWAAGTRDVTLVLPWTELTGRRLGTGWSPLADMPFRQTLIHDATSLTT